MKRIDLGALLQAVSALAVMTERLVRPIDVMKHDGTLWITLGEIGPSLGRHLKTIADIVDPLDLPVTTGAISSYRSALGRLTANKNTNNAFGLTQSVADALRRAYDHLITGVTQELSQHRSFVIDPTEVKLLDHVDDHFGKEALIAFPGIGKDVVAAAECQTYGLWTASVMHLMRVAETGVAAFADDLTVPIGKSWGITINEILKALDDAKGQKGAPELQARLKADPSFKQWASEVASYLNFVKDAFRNPAMHPDLNFDRDEAIVISHNTRSLMRALAKRVTQKAQIE